jgi:protein-tyrosine phosphatase
VHLTRSLAEQDLSALCYERIRYLLLELPYAPFDHWMSDEIWNIANTQNLMPVYAHLERYLNFMTETDLQELIALTPCIVQLNVSVFESKRSHQFMKLLASQGTPLVLGTDAHNLTTRPASFSAAKKHLLGNRPDKPLYDHITASDFLARPTRIPAL